MLWDQKKIEDIENAVISAYNLKSRAPILVKQVATAFCWSGNASWYY